MSPKLMAVLGVVVLVLAAIGLFGLTRVLLDTTRKVAVAMAVELAGLGLLGVLIAVGARSDASIGPVLFLLALLVGLAGLAIVAPLVIGFVSIPFLLAWAAVVSDRAQFGLQWTLLLGLLPLWIMFANIANLLRLRRVPGFEHDD